MCVLLYPSHQRKLALEFLEVAVITSSHTHSKFLNASWNFWSPENHRFCLYNGPAQMHNSYSEILQFNGETAITLLSESDSPLTPSALHAWLSVGMSCWMIDFQILQRLIRMLEGGERGGREGEREREWSYFRHAIQHHELYLPFLNMHVEAVV